MSTRSPASSCVTACTREPRMPTQVPIGSMRRSSVNTAILARTPGSRAAALISSRPSSISGTSSSNSSMMNSGAVRDRMSCGPAGAVDAQQVGAHAVADAQVLLRDHLVARQHRLDPARLDDRVAALHALDGAGDELLAARRGSRSGSARARRRGSSAGSPAWRSARRCGRTRSSRAAPRCSPRPGRRRTAAFASESGIWCAGNSTASSGTTCQRRNDSYSPVLRSIATRTSTSSVKRFLVAEPSASSSAPNTMSLSTFFSRASASTSSSSSRLIPKLLKVRHQPGLVHVREGERHERAVHFQLDALRRSPRAPRPRTAAARRAARAAAPRPSRRQSAGNRPASSAPGPAPATRPRAGRIRSPRPPARAAAAGSRARSR